MATPHALLSNEGYRRQLCSVLGLVVDRELPAELEKLLATLERAEATRRGKFDFHVHIDIARDHVIRGQAIVERQRKVVARFPSRVPFTRMAERLLTTFEELQNAHLAHLKRLEQGHAAAMHLS